MKLRPSLFAVVLLMISTLVLAHGGHKHVSGTVVSADKTAIVVKTSAGNVSVPLFSTTKYYHGSDTRLPATATEVESGMRVVVHLGGDGKAVEVHIPSTPEKVGVLEGKIVSRDDATNKLTVEHGEVKGVMGAMTMEYDVRGQKVDSLPKDGSKITARMHESGGKHWLTDVTPRRLR